jgi:hypothetical protein
MRFFAEAAWYPTALLPSQGIRWEEADIRSARASLVDGPVAVTMLFSFNEDGTIDTVRAEARGRRVGDQIIPTPWQGRFWNYQQQDVMLVRSTGRLHGCCRSAQSHTGAVVSPRSLMSFRSNGCLEPPGRTLVWRCTRAQLDPDFRGRLALDCHGLIRLLREHDIQARAVVLAAFHRGADAADRPGLQQYERQPFR